MRFAKASAAAALAALPAAFAQTSTDCDPTKKSCPADTGLPSSAYTADFTQGSSANASWSAAAYTTINYGQNGAEFTISGKNQAPTVQTDFYIFFGRIDVKMKAAPGQGIISSIVLESDDLDEIDWEFIGSNTQKVETNFFGKGNTTSYDRAIYYDVQTPQNTFHTYTIDWNADRLEFIIDGTTVRTLAYTDPLTNGGNNYPQTPMRLKLGNWAGGGPGEPEGTVEWAGGKTDFSKGPFTMYVESVSIQNYNPADSYEYSDKTGSWESIKIVKDGSSSNPSGSGGSTSGTASATGTGSGSLAGTNATLSATLAPTSSLGTVAPIMPTAAAVSSTQTGSAYSTNSASVSAQNSGTIVSSDDAGSMTRSVVTATTEVPGTEVTATGAAGSDGSGSDSSATATSSGDASSTDGAAQQTSSSGASLNAVIGAGSLFGVALSVFMF